LKIVKAITESIESVFKIVGNDGKEEKLYISPNITLGALNVYDLNKQRLTTETLVEKQYIGKELAEQLKTTRKPGTKTGAKRKAGTFTVSKKRAETKTGAEAKN
jgi:hypothetical protein